MRGDPGGADGIRIFHSADGDRLDIRVIARGIGAAPTRAVGRRIVELLETRHPELRFEYRYFDQADWFGVVDDAETRERAC